VKGKAARKPCFLNDVHTRYGRAAKTLFAATTKVDYARAQSRLLCNVCGTRRAHNPPIPLGRLRGRQASIAAIATPERAEYFASAGNLMLAEETILLDRAPIAELNPLWSGDRDWLPGDPPFGGAEGASTLAISGSVLDFLPGGLAAYWDGYRKLDGTRASRPDRRVFCNHGPAPSTTTGTAVASKRKIAGGS
jgi:hypothetical protein